MAADIFAEDQILARLLECRGMKRVRLPIEVLV
jgi:hypothetical protein